MQFSIRPQVASLRCGDNRRFRCSQETEHLSQWGTFFSLLLTRNVKFSFAFQLKHCSRYIHDLFPSLIKNLDPVPLRHVLNLVSGLHPNAHTEQVTLRG